MFFYFTRGRKCFPTLLEEDNVSPTLVVVDNVSPILLEVNNVSPS